MADPIKDLGPAFDCPICKKAQVHHLQIVKRFAADSHEFTCPNCGASFAQMDVNSFQLKRVPDAYSYAGNYYKEDTRTAEGWQQLPILPNAEIEAIEAGQVNVIASLPEMESPLVLQRDERAIFRIGACEFLEDRTQRQRTSLPMSFAVGHGMRVYLPSASQTVTVRKMLDRGTFVLTNKRYAFIGSSKTVSAKIDRIVSVMLYQDGFALARAGKQSIEFFLGFPGATYGTIVKRALQELQSGAAAPPHTSILVASDS